MNTHIDKSKKNKEQVATNDAIQSQGSNNTATQFDDHRPDTIFQRKAQEMANEHSKQQNHPIQKKENNTGLPDTLKSGIENLSGYSMDDVKVHRNSNKPAQLQAHAYTQGTDIHLGPGQEKHLPHEAWHVVQQKQGRVKPTMQMKGKVNVNDDVGLEKEADVMGKMAIQSKTNGNVNQNLLRKNSKMGSAVLQHVKLEGGDNISEAIPKLPITDQIATITVINSGPVFAGHTRIIVEHMAASGALKNTLIELTSSKLSVVNIEIHQKWLSIKKNLADASGKQSWAVSTANAIKLIMKAQVLKGNKDMYSYKLFGYSNIKDNVMNCTSFGEIILRAAGIHVSGGRKIKKPKNLTK